MFLQLFIIGIKLTQGSMFHAKCSSKIACLWSLPPWQVCLTFATIISFKVAGHKASSTTFIWRVLPMKANDFAILIHFVIFQNIQLNFRSLVHNLLGRAIRILPFLSTTSKSQHKMRRGRLSNVAVRQRMSNFQLLGSKDQSLLVRRNSFLILDLGHYIFYCTRGLNLENEGLSCKSFHENLYLGSNCTADGRLEMSYSDS